MKISALILWRIYLGLVLFSGLLLLAYYFSGAALAIGNTSSFRWVVIIAVALVEAGCLFLLVQAWINPGRTDSRLQRLRQRTASPHRQAAIYLLGFLLLLVCMQVFLLAPEVSEIYSRLIFLRLQPAALWAAGVTAISLVGFGLWHSARPVRFSTHRSFWITLGILLLSLLAWTLLARPFIPELVNRAGWNATGVPVVEWQMVLAWLGGLALVGLAALIERWIGKHSRPGKSTTSWADLAIAVLLWLLAVTVWQSIEISPSWFVTERLPPNREFYPSSDARLYDTVAQDALDGAGFRFYRSAFIRRPLHGLYLLVLHLAAGQKYQTLVFYQILILALLPVTMYFLVKAFHNRFSGAIAALILLLREANSIALAGTITAAHVKVLLVDLLTTLLVLLFAAAAFRWLKSVTDTPANGLGTGGLLGLAMLVRLETSAFIPALLTLLFLVLLPARSWKTFWVQSLTFLLGMALVISPWVVRNWTRTGQVFIDSPGHRQSLILQRFTLWKDLSLAPSALPSQPVTPTALAQPAAGTPSPGTAATQTQPAPVSTLGELSLDPQSLGGLAAYFMAHFLNSEVQSLLYLPATFRGLDSLVSLSGHGSLERFLAGCCSLKDYVRRLPFWHRWTGEFPRQSLLLIGMNLLVLSGGLSLMWRRQGWIGLLPVMMWFFYLLAHAVFRNSGGRYILPVDWVASLYFSIGLAHFSGYLNRRFFKPSQPGVADQQAFHQPQVASRPARAKFITYPLFLVCMLVSLSIPIVERSIPARFSSAQQDRMLTALLDSPELTASQVNEIKAALQSGSVAEVGRALYPQYFRSGYGAPGYEQGPLSARIYPRLVFFLTGAASSDMALPVDKRVSAIPDGSTALAIVCPADYPNFPEVLAAGFFNPAGGLERVYYRSAAAQAYACDSFTVP